ncbi:MAG: hypothetical protein IKC32_07405 [Clostridia bacterium]|nr:hypothetical protein [Clostridia bacterium]
MEIGVKDPAKSIRSRALLGLFVLIGGVVCAAASQLGLLFAALLAAPLASLFLVESECKPVFSIISSLCVIGVDLLFNGIYSFACVGGVVISVIIFICYKTAFLAKAEGALLATVVISAVMALTVYMWGAYMAKSVEPASVLAYFDELLADLRAVFTEYIARSVAMDKTGELALILTPEVASDLFDSYLNEIYSTVAILAFTIVGLSYKLFGVVFKRYTDKPESLSAWRFSLTPLYGYFYLALYVLQIFAGREGAFALAVSNLTTFFMLVLAYVGLRSIREFTRRRGTGGGLSTAFFILMLVVSPSITVSLLSFIGAYVTCKVKDNAQSGTDGTAN